MDMCLVCKDNAPYKMLSLPDGNAVLRVDKKNIIILYASGIVQRIPMSLFSGTLKLEDLGFQNEFLLWKQVKHMLVAIDRFNVASFWNTLTGKLLYKTILDADSRIENVINYKRHEF